MYSVIDHIFIPKQSHRNQHTDYGMSVQHEYSHCTSKYGDERVIVELDLCVD